MAVKVGLGGVGRRITRVLALHSRAVRIGNACHVLPKFSPVCVEIRTPAPSDPQEADMWALVLLPLRHNDCWSPGPLIQ